MKENNKVILITTIIVSFISGAIGAIFMIKNVNVVSESIIKNVSSVELTEESIATSVDKIKDAVVVVTTYQNDIEAATGTGFVYKKNDKIAYVLTNNHVVDGGDKIELTFTNNTTVTATLVGAETYSDIAVLSVPVSSIISVCEIGDSTKVNVGDTVFTVGSPMGKEYAGTVTKGILSGKDRLVEVSFSGNSSDYYMKVLQTDAAINPGNSGGPLLNVNGEVIGINSLKLVKDTIEGMGFAISIEDALNYTNMIEDGGTVRRPYLGISMLDITDTYYLMQNGITIPNDVKSGVAVVSVEKGSCADKAGIKKGDIILSINSENTDTVAELRYELYKYEPGNEIEIKLYRDGTEKKIKVTLDEK